MMMAKAKVSILAKLSIWIESKETKLYLTQLGIPKDNNLMESEVIHKLNEVCFQPATPEEMIESAIHYPFLREEGITVLGTGPVYYLDGWIDDEDMPKHWNNRERDHSLYGEENAMLYSNTSKFLVKNTQNMSI